MKREDLLQENLKLRDVLRSIADEIDDVLDDDEIESDDRDE